MSRGISRKTMMRVAFVAAGVLCAVTAAQPVLAKPYSLAQLVDMARRGNPGVMAGGAATAAMEAQVSEARRNWYPSGELLSTFSMVPKVQCRGQNQNNTFVSPGLPDRLLTPTERESDCVTTNALPIDNPGIVAQLAGPWTRTELKLIQPLWDFGKISAGVTAAESGVEALRAKQSGAAFDVELNVRKAYWGLKLARELLDALAEGGGYIADAQKKLEKELDQGTGNATVTDKLRLRTVRAEVDARTLETKRLASLALVGLRTLVGPEAPADLDVDDSDFEPLEIPQRPVTYYEDQARLNRPEVRALDFALKAKHALSDLERRREYPDLFLIGSASFAYAPTIDTPKNAFLSNPFNSFGAGLAAGLRMPLDLGPKLARADRVHAEADEFEFRRREALGGIALEVRKAYEELSEATARVETLNKGQKAGKAWVTAVAQNFAIGLAEARDFSEALNAFFQMRARYLQSVYDLNVAAAALGRATGTSLP